MRAGCLLLLCLLSGAAGAGQYCRDYRPVTTPSEDFTIHHDGTVTHRRTGLMWMRCSQGQAWTGTTCEGHASKHSWRDAMQLADEREYAGYDDWRLPEREEMESLLEKRCETPMINLEIFPNTPSNWYWTASMPGLEDDSHMAWYVSFSLGRVHNQRKENRNRVRLVRTP